MGHRDDAYIRDSDAFSWYMEADPLLRSTIVSVVVLEAAPDVARLFDRIERASRLSPGFRHKVVQAPLRLANPRWVVDPDFNLAFHVRHIAAPAPGTLADVFEYACQTGMAGLRPPTAALGVHARRRARGRPVRAGHEAASLAHRRHRRHGDGEIPLRPRDPTPATLGPMPDRSGTGAVVVGRSRTRRAAPQRGACRQPLERVPRAMLAAPRRPALRHPRPRCATALRLRPVGRAHGAARELDPVAAHAGSTTRLALRRVHRAARRAPQAPRDAAASRSTTRSWPRSAVDSSAITSVTASRVDELRLTMPISIRTPDDPIGGNRITLMRFKIPIGVRDPVARMRRDRTSCASPLDTNRRSVHERDRRRAQRPAPRRRRRDAQARRLPREQCSRHRRPRVPRRRTGRASGTRSARRSAPRSTRRSCPTTASATSA